MGTQKEEADKYQDFFNFMKQEHDLILTIHEMNEILVEAINLAEKISIKPEDLTIKHGA